MPTSTQTHTPPLDFMIIGSGDVVSKYWMRSHREKLLRITHIVSLETEESFRSRHPEYEGEFYQTTTNKNTYEYFASHINKKPTNIALVATSDTRFPLLSHMLSDNRFVSAQFFIEKPYVSNRDEYQKLSTYVKIEPHRLHFSRRYTTGRADILLSALPKDVLPTRITARLIEGSEYFQSVQRKTRGNEKRQNHVDVGPEIDMGFHLIDITLNASRLFGGKSSFQLQNSQDLSSLRNGFLPGYGFQADIQIHLEGSQPIPFDIQVGKADVENERFIDFDYGDYSIKQVYTVGNAQDPVYKVLHTDPEHPILLAKHSLEHNYYAVELSSGKFCHQSHSEQDAALLTTDLTFRIKEQKKS